MVHDASRGNRALGRAAAAWWSIALVGQWAFFVYIVAFYGASIATQDLEAWNRLSAFGRAPYVAGDSAGNFAFAAHALGAGIVALGGALQLIPGLRARFPAFHRWNGRVFLATVVALALSGFYLVWFRGEPPGSIREYATSVNGALILAFAGLAYRHARARAIAAHRRWALRLYLLSNAQWFLRVGVFAYLIGGRALGFEPQFSDAFVRFWSFGCFLVPLAVLECYLWAERSELVLAKRAVAAGLIALTLSMAVGMVGYGLVTRLIATGAPLPLG